MPVLNSDIARNLDKLADLIELEAAIRSASALTGTQRACRKVPRPRFPSTYPWAWHRL
jgi:hypothetical protein